MPDPRRLFGTAIEKQVARFLKEKGYEIIAHQWKTAFGEIDLICRDADEIVFIEVKARFSSQFGYPEESVHAVKLQKIIRCAQAFLETYPEEQSWRIDVVAVEMNSPVKMTHLQAVDTSSLF